MVQNMFKVYSYSRETYVFMSPSILAFNSVLLKGHFFGFGGQKIGYFEGWDPVKIVLGYTSIA